MKPITAFIPYTGAAGTQGTVEQLQASGFVEHIVLLATGTEVPALPGCESIAVPALHSSATMAAIGKKLRTPYALLLLHDTLIAFGQFGLERMVGVATQTGAGLVFSDYYDMKDGIRTAHPVMECQFGSLRDDFNFGSVVLLERTALRKALAEKRSGVLFRRMVCVAARPHALGSGRPGRRVSVQQS